MALLHVDFFSDVLGMSRQMDVILPEQTSRQIGMVGKRPDGKYPALYLLHGMSDDHTIWQRRTSIERYASELGIAVIMPSVDLGWYTDMAYGYPYWTYISQEIPSVCHAFFPNISQKREDTFAAGLSMGGYGALKCGLCAPETFGAVASLSGAVDITSSIMDEKGNGMKQYWEDVFGPAESVRGSENDLMAAAERLKASGKPMPAVYMWCGTEDFLINQNLRMKDHLQKLGYSVTFEASPGDHEWNYWDEKIQTVLSWLPLPGKNKEAR